MKRFHVVRKQGRFDVVVAQTLACFGEKYSFHSYEGAMHFYRYYVSYLGWKFGFVEFVPADYGTVVLIAYTDCYRGVSYESISCV